MALETMDFESLFAGFGMAMLVMILIYLANRNVFSVARTLLKQGTGVVDDLLFIAANADPADIAKMIKKQKGIQMLEENKLAVDPTIKAAQNELLKDAVGKKIS